MRVALVVLVLMLLVAGCASKGAPKGGANATGNVTAASLPRNDDGSSKTATVDTGAMPHMHDYWKSRERVTLFEGDVDPGQPDPSQVLVSLAVQKQAKAGDLEWHLPDGQIVYEGTGEMDVTATWTDPKTTSLQLAFKAASDTQYRTPVELVSGKSTPIVVTPDMTDMPHTKASRWTFDFAPAASPGAMLAPFHLKIDIVKLRDINVFPAHPDLFAGAHEKVINDKSYQFTEESYVTRVPQLLQNGDFQEKIVTPQQIVPMETQWLRAEVDIDSASSTPGSVVDVNFFYHGANTTYLGHPAWLPTAGSFASKHMQWDFPVTMDETDSPYAKDSQWRFFVEPSVALADGTPKMGGMTQVSISYHLKLTVYDHVPDGAKASKSEYEGGSG
jgi:hypothetical protein